MSKTASYELNLTWFIFVLLEENIEEFDDDDVDEKSTPMEQ